jgi:hypothetical protein
VSKPEVRRYGGCPLAETPVSIEDSRAAGHVVASRSRTMEALWKRARPGGGAEIADLGGRAFVERSTSTSVKRSPGSSRAP